MDLTDDSGEEWSDATPQKPAGNGASRPGRGPGKRFTSKTAPLAAKRRHAPASAPDQPESAPVYAPDLSAEQADPGFGGPVRKSRTLLRRIHADATEQIQTLLNLTRAKLATLADAKPQEYRAISAILLPIHESASKALELQGSAKGEPTYEERIAQVYRERGLPAPGRLNETLKDKICTACNGTGYHVYGDAARDTR